MENIKACYHCESKEVSVSYSIQNNEAQTKHYYGECHNCSAMGPERPDEETAIKHWNTRPIEDKLREALKGAGIAINLMSPYDEKHKAVKTLIREALKETS